MVYTSFIQHAPFLKRYYRYYLPFFPRAIRHLKIPKGYDLVLSSSHCVAKGISKDPAVPHITYCHTPMRYLWVMSDAYFEQNNKLAGKIFPLFKRYLKKWDLASNKNVDYFIGNSHHVAKRISQFYDRKAEVIHPPVETSRFSISNTVKDYYLIVSAFVPYKRIDLAISAFNELGLPLYVVGKGPEEKRLKRMAKPNVSFLGWRSTNELKNLLSECQAFIFPGEEDFGIAPVEAMASGRPVIAYKKGGALETVTDQTGVFFKEQTKEALSEAVTLFESQKSRFNPQAIRKHALIFDKESFKDKMREYIERHVIQRTNDR